MQTKLLALGTFLALAMAASSYTHAQGTFAGYQCTLDCSGHEAGYQWAEDNGITDPDNCGGNSQSFIEGCMAYANGLSPDEEDNHDNADGDTNDNDEDDDNDEY